jgi:hypothetical protein
MTTDLPTRRHLGRPILAGWLVGAAVMGGCASFSVDGGFSTAEQTAKDRIGKDPTTRRACSERFL